MAALASQPRDSEEQVSLKVAADTEARRFGVGAPHRSGDEPPHPGEAYVRTPRLQGTAERTRYGT
jgi:hypothetical protein